MNHDCIDLFIIVDWVLLTAREKWLFDGLGFKIKLFVVEDAYLDFALSLRKNIRILIISTLKRNVNLFVQCDIFKHHFDHLSCSSKLGNVPNTLS